MIGRLASEETQRSPVLTNAARLCFQFVPEAAQGQTLLMEFADPVPTKAVRVDIGPKDRLPDDALVVLAVPGLPSEDPQALNAMTAWVMEATPTPNAPPITITLHGTLLVWHPVRVAILAPAERMDALLTALVEFAYYEREIGKLERTTAEAWPQLQADMPLAFEVTSRDLDRQEEVRKQVQRMLTVRMHHARIAPRLIRPGTHLATLALQLGERLREKARIEDRLETLANQLDVFERVYEMCSQRFSEYRTSKAETTLEWVIIVLLAAETVLLLIDLLLNLER